MTGSERASWEALLEAVEVLAGVETPSPERCSGALAYLELSSIVAGTDVRFGARSGVVVLELASTLDRAGLANSVTGLGPPIDMSIVSPPVFDPARPGNGPDWEFKQSHGHQIGGRKVWFGLETTQGVERLVHVAIHYEETDVED